MTPHPLALASRWVSYKRSDVTRSAMWSSPSLTGIVSDNYRSLLMIQLSITHKKSVNFFESWISSSWSLVV